MRRIAIAAILGLAACTNGAPMTQAPLTPDKQTVRTVTQGDLIGGLTEDGGHAWRSVPFAAPPIGSLRWRAPRPAEPWSGTREALAFAPPCPQLTSGLEAGRGGTPGQLQGEEDCLYLNIYAPAFAPDQVPQDGDALPVMVWIHGGGNVWGSADTYHGGVLAHSQDVIVVTIQYRLGPIGWFAHEALRTTSETDLDASANFGTLDIISSLAWIRDNIAAFGGDPSRVTIFGESAGGHNVASLLISPPAEGLFHRAIIQSGSFDITSLADAEYNGDGPYASQPSRKMIAGWLGEDGLAADLSGQDLVSYLQDLPLDRIFEAYHDGQGNIGPPRIIADGVTLPKDGFDTLSDPNAFNAVPVMSGTNRHETKLFNLLNPDMVDRYFGVLSFAKDPDLYDAIGDYESLAWRIRAVDEPLRQMKAGGLDTLYAYRFDWDEEGTFLFTDYSHLIGAAHGIEIPFVFGWYNLLGPADDIVFNDRNAPGRAEVSGAMMSYWAQFAYSGAPGKGRGAKLPEWQAWSEDDGGPKVKLIDTSEGGGLRMNSVTETQDSLFSALMADSRLDTNERRCAAVKAVIAWAPDFEEAGRPHHVQACTASGADQ